MINWNHCRTGSLIEIMDGFGITIGGDYKNKNIIFCGLKKFKTNLNIQEKIWLETLAYISSILLENFQLIEGLFQKIEDYKEKKKRYMTIILRGFQDYYLRYRRRNERIYRSIYMILFSRIYCSC